jgi:hypothetical protein
MARVIKSKTKKRRWQDIAKEAQDYRDASIARVTPEVPHLPANLPKNVMNIPRELLSQEEAQITEAAPEVLLQLMASGQLSATAVCTAFLRRAGLAQRLVRIIILNRIDSNHLNHCRRPTALQSFYQNGRFHALSTWTTTLPNMDDPLVLSTVYPLASRSTLVWRAYP